MESELRVFNIGCQLILVPLVPLCTHSIVYINALSENIIHCLTCPDDVPVSDVKYESFKNAGANSIDRIGPGLLFQVGAVSIHRNLQRVIRHAEQKTSRGRGQWPYLQISFSIHCPTNLTAGKISQ